MQLGHDFWTCKTTRAGLATIATAALACLQHQMSPLHAAAFVVFAIFQICRRDALAKQLAVLALPEADRAKLFQLVEGDGK